MQAGMPMMRGILRFNATDVCFSPFEEGRLAVSAAQHFGIVGNGRQSVLYPSQMQGLAEVAGYDTQDAAMACAWSEANNNQLATGCGDGSVKVWDLGPQMGGRPWRSFVEHQKEANGVSFGVGSSRSLLLSCSWDMTIKMWDPGASNRSISTWREHTGSIYAVRFSPQSPTAFASCGGDRRLLIWDSRGPRATHSMVGHGHEVLCLDWNKYTPSVIATGCADRNVYLWDLRKAQGPLRVMPGHRFAVKCVRFSPFSASEMLTGSYDLTVGIWDATRPEPLIKQYRHHSEFVTGVDYSLFRKGQVASCSWDKTVCVWNTASPMPAPR